MSVRPYREILRRRSRQVMVGKVAVGGDAPISVQSMTNTLTTDVKATVAQIHALEEAGADIVRVSFKAILVQGCVVRHYCSWRVGCVNGRRRLDCGQLSN